MNAERLSKMQSQVRIGGKGTQRRKKKVVHKTNTDDKKLQNTLKKLAVNIIPGIEEVHMIKDDGHVIHFNNPKVQASLPANTYAITGHAETKPVTDLMPRMLNTNTLGTTDDADDDVPELVGDFDSAAAAKTDGGDKKDTTTGASASSTPTTSTTSTTQAPASGSSETPTAPAASSSPSSDPKPAN